MLLQREKKLILNFNSRLNRWRKTCEEQVIVSSLVRVGSNHASRAKHLTTQVMMRRLRPNQEFLSWINKNLLVSLHLTLEVEEFLKTIVEMILFKTKSWMIVLILMVFLGSCSRKKP